MARKTGKKTDPSAPLVGCTIRQLPPHLQVAAAATAIGLNPANAPPMELMMTALAFGGDDALGVPAHIAFTNRYWGPKGVDLGVTFLDNPTAGFRKKFLAHANAWRTEAGANVKFRESRSGGQVRLAREPGSGHWSFVGGDILHVDGPTMNLDSFTEGTPDSEWTRVVRHEVGHTIGCPHEQQRQAVLDLLDQERTIAYFMASQGWSREQVMQQVLTPLETRSLVGASASDVTSIMCYAFPAECTKSGRPIPGGSDFSPTDKAWAAKAYPLPDAPPDPPPQPPAGGPLRVVVIDWDQKRLIIDGVLSPTPAGRTARAVAVDWAGRTLAVDGQKV